MAMCHLLARAKNCQSCSNHVICFYVIFVIFPGHFAALLRLPAVFLSCFVKPGGRRLVGLFALCLRVLIENTALCVVALELDLFSKSGNLVFVKVSK